MRRTTGWPSSWKSCHGSLTRRVALLSPYLSAFPRFQLALVLIILMPPLYSLLATPLLYRLIAPNPPLYRLVRALVTVMVYRLLPLLLLPLPPPRPPALLLLLSLAMLLHRLYSTCMFPLFSLLQPIALRKGKQVESLPLMHVPNPSRRPKLLLV
jgi:hypothetical protein